MKMYIFILAVFVALAWYMQPTDTVREQATHASDTDQKIDEYTK